MVSRGRRQPRWLVWAWGSVLLLLLANQLHHRHRVVRSTQPTLLPPGDLTPAMAGALVRGHIRPVLQQATILALACRHVLVLEPIGEHWVAIHLLSDQHLNGAIEQTVWHALLLEATPEHFVSDVTLKQYNADWAVAGEVVRQELVSEGYFEAQARRWQGCFGVLGTCGLIAAFFELLATGIGRENWGWLGFGVFVAGAVVAFLGAYHVPETTVAGEQAGAPWRNYLAGLEAAAHHPEQEVDLNQATPYALALGASRFLAHRLRLAEQRGYHPAWLGTLDQTQQRPSGFYRYWQAFSRDLRPPARVLFTSNRAGFRLGAKLHMLDHD